MNAGHRFDQMTGHSKSKWKADARNLEWALWYGRNTAEDPEHSESVEIINVDLKLLREIIKGLEVEAGSKAKKVDKEHESNAIDAAKFIIHYRTDLIAHASGSVVKMCSEGGKAPLDTSPFFVCKDADATK